MDLTEMLANLVLDLKMTLDTEISTAEGTRCIQKAVDDLSRHTPRERIYEHTWVEEVTDDSFATPAAASATLFVNAFSLSGVAEGTAATLATTWNTVPRPIAFLITDADNSTTRATIIVKGIDADGVYREERFYRHNGKSQTGKVYFSSIYEVEINEIAGGAANDTLSIGIAAPNTAGAEVWIQLTNPVKPGSESIYSGLLKTGTKYTLDTDYEMDYANGRIRMKSGGSLAASTTYYANYKKHNLSVDISPVLNDLVRVTKVLYPADKVPEQQVAFGIWENMLTIGSQRTGESQKALVDKEHIAIHYESNHTPPTFVGPGSYPAYLDELVLKGAGGYALLVEALQHELQAVTDLASVRTELGKVTTLVTPTTGKIDLALTKVASYLETNDTTDNAQEILADITDNVASLRTAVGTALDAANAYLDDVDVTDLGQATVGAEGLLATGDDLINTVPTGKDAAGLYEVFSGARVRIALARTQAAQAYVQEAELRLTNLRTQIEEASGWMRMGEDFIGEAQALVAECNSIIQEAAQYQETVANEMLLSDRFRAEGQARLAEFRELLRSKAEYRKRIVDVSVRQPK